MKKTFLVVALACMQMVLMAQSKNISSSITQVTVFTQGAQIERKATVNLLNGKNTLMLTGLSPYINKESIKITGDGSFTIMGVQYRYDHLTEIDKGEDKKAIEDKIEELNLKIEEEGVQKSILKGKIEFLNVNKQVGGKETNLSPEAFQSLKNIYGNSLESLSLESMKRDRTIKELKKELEKNQRQLNSLNSSKSQPSGTIIVDIESNIAKSAKINFSYLVNSSVASWHPSYDIRFEGSNKPINISYKANISQNTGINWENVKLVLSTAQTNVSAKMPSFSPYYLQYYVPIARKYSSQAPMLYAEEEVLEECSANTKIRVRGSSILTASSEPIYIVDGKPMNKIDHIPTNSIASMDVLKDASATSIYGAQGANGVILITTKKADSSVPMTITNQMETANEFSVKNTQTINTGSSTNIAYREAKLNAAFEYQSLPRLSQHVFLVAKIADWHQAKLNNGEVNLYLENSYVGKSVIDTQQFTDSLLFSFGVDNNISIKRDKLANYNEKQIISSNQKEFTGYKLTLRNNKAYPISTKVTDQIPISSTKEIEVENIELSGGKLDKDSGKLEWNISLAPKETKEIIVKYSVRYPKDKKIILE